LSIPQVDQLPLDIIQALLVDVQFGLLDLDLLFFPLSVGFPFTLMILYFLIN